MNRQVDVKALVSHIIRGDGLDKCRICMGDTSQGQVHLGDTVMMDGDKPVTLSELLELITGVSIERMPCLPPHLCRACFSPVTDFLPFFLLCRESAQKWNKIVHYLDSVSVEKQAKTAYVLMGDEPKTLADRSTTKNKTPKEVIEKIRVRLRYIRSAQKAKEKSWKEKGSGKFTCPDCRRGDFEHIYKFNHHLNTNKKHCCPKCLKIIELKEFGKHLQSHDLPSFECNICHLHFEDEKRLLKHKPFHRTGKFVCPECKYTFLTMDRLTVHSSYVHTAVRCNCDKFFYNKKCYSVHKKNSCPKKRVLKYICDYCSKEFKQKCILRHHIENFHTVKVYTEQCDKCGKTFKKKAHLKEHSYMHDKVLDRFTCEYCGKNYTTPRGYRRHMTRHYEVNPEMYKKKKYPCEICSKLLMSETNLKNHMFRQHQLHSNME